MDFCLDAGGPLRVGQRFGLTTQVVRKVDKPCGGTVEAAPAWSGISEAQGGNHFTLRDWSVAAPSRSSYPSGSQRHPRTGLGITDDGRVLFAIPWHEHVVVGTTDSLRKETPLEPRPAADAELDADIRLLTRQLEG